MTISEVCLATGFTADTLRYYEKIGLIPPVKRSSGGKRDYSEKDLEQLNFINCMKKAGCSLEVIEEYRDLYQLGKETVNERLELLTNQKQALMKALNDLQASINYLDNKIEYTKLQK
ncbi:MAG: MerR family transcriptional regulator [Chthoniobacterales bacterium]